MVDAYCPVCNDKTKYCLGDQHQCISCDRYFGTHQVIDEDDYFLLDECPIHGLEHGGFTIRYDSDTKKNERFCITCDQRFVKVKIVRLLDTENPKRGIRRLMNPNGDRYCERRFTCETYPTECAKCRHAWKSKYKRLSLKKIKEILTKTRQRLGKAIDWDYQR